MIWGNYFDGLVSRKAWDEDEHPREPKGSDKGGEFAPANMPAAWRPGAAYPAALPAQNRPGYDKIREGLNEMRGWSNAKIAAALVKEHPLPWDSAFNIAERITGKFETSPARSQAALYRIQQKNSESKLPPLVGRFLVEPYLGLSRFPELIHPDFVKGGG